MVDAPLRPEVAVDVVDALVRAGIHDHALQGTARERVHRRIIADGPARIVVPAGDAEDRHLHPVQAALDAQRAPVVILLLVIEPVVPELRAGAPGQSLRSR